MVRNRLNAAHTFQGSILAKGSEHLKSGTKFAMAGVAVLAIAMPLVPSAASAVAVGHAQIKHVLLISVDGMHQSDLDWYVANHPNSELTRRKHSGLGLSYR
jgi:hypothetical protein